MIAYLLDWPFVVILAMFAGFMFGRHHDRSVRVGLRQELRDAAGVIYRLGQNLPHCSLQLKGRPSEIIAKWGRKP